MESDRKSSVISRSMHFDGLFQPLHQKKFTVLERQNQLKVFTQKWNSNSNSGFTVIPTKELCRVYLHKPSLLASKGIIDAQSSPPHTQKKSFKIYGEMSNHRKFVRRSNQQNLKSKLKHHIDPLKPKIQKNENSPRSFSPLGFGSSSQLRDRKKSKEMKKPCEKEIVVSEVASSKLMVSTSRDSVLRLKRVRSDRVAANVKLRDTSSSDFISKDENEDSLDCSDASPGCQTNSEEAHQPSPVSVLDPIFMEDMLDDTEELPYLDFHGLEKQIETLKSESESYSEGSGMEVSSDEESEVDTEPVWFLDAQESRDSSYIDDILAEVVPVDKNLDFLKIFEKLEKKYYIDTSWKRSERRILFDRVNSGLVEILESFKAIPTWKKPVSRRLGTTLSIFGLKQELWKVLAKQEKGHKKESLGKVPVIDIDEWLELESDDESMVCELESMIVNDLLDEIVSFM